MNIKELHEALSTYPKGRPVIADLVTYDYLTEFLTDSDTYGKYVSPKISIEDVWNKLLTEGESFTLEYGYENMSDRIQDWLTANKLWVEQTAGCNCNECECKNEDDYTAENETCEDCFRDCLPTEGGQDEYISN